VDTLEIESPLSTEVVNSLRAGNRVLLSGIVYTARDAAHRRLVEILGNGGKLPFDISGQTVYYMGPSPAPPGRVIGSAGPTTSGRMDVYTPKLLAAGLRAMIGKGSRSKEVREAMVRHRAVYFAAIGGAGALISKTVVEAETVAFADLGPEAVRRLRVVKLPLVVINDTAGSDFYQMGKEKYRL
jgi:fumarate hydratase subunit beta